MTAEEFKRLILPLKHKLFRYALSFLPNEAEAKDVVQEVMIKCWEEVKRPQGIQKLEAWCMTVLRNRCLDRLKKKGRNYLPIMEQYDLCSPEADPLRKTENQEVAQRIREIIARLDAKQREVITLRDVEGYSFKEIAALMKIKENHVRVLLHRARTQVKTQLIKVNNHGITQAR